MTHLSIAALATLTANFVAGWVNRDEVAFNRLALLVFGLVVYGLVAAAMTLRRRSLARDEMWWAVGYVVLLLGSGMAILGMPRLNY